MYPQFLANSGIKISDSVWLLVSFEGKSKCDTITPIKNPWITALMTAFQATSHIPQIRKLDASLPRVSPMGIRLFKPTAPECYTDSTKSLTRSKRTIKTFKYRLSKIFWKPSTPQSGGKQWPKEEARLKHLIACYYPA